MHYLTIGGMAPYVFSAWDLSAHLVSMESSLPNLMYPRSKEAERQFQKCIELTFRVLLTVKEKKSKYIKG